MKGEVRDVRAGAWLDALRQDLRFGFPAPAGGRVAWVGCGLGADLALAAAVGRSMASLVYGVEPLDGLSRATAVCLLAVVGLIAALRPVWRATRVDPIAVLRAEKEGPATTGHRTRRASCRRAGESWQNQVMSLILGPGTRNREPCRRRGVWETASSPGR